MRTHNILILIQCLIYDLQQACFPLGHWINDTQNKGYSYCPPRQWDMLTKPTYLVDICNEVYIVADQYSDGSQHMKCNEILGYNDSLAWVEHSFRLPLTFDLRSQIFGNHPIIYTIIQNETQYCTLALWQLIGQVNMKTLYCTIELKRS